MPAKKKTTFPDVKEKLDTINKELSSTATIEKHTSFAKAVLLSHYGLFITVVWKSFEMNGDIPGTAKFSLIFFGLGILFSVLGFLSDYFSEGVDTVPQIKELVQIEKEHGELIKKNDKALYQDLYWVNKCVRFCSKNTLDDDVPTVLMAIAYTFIDYIFLVLSAFSLFLGLVFLGFSAI